MNRLFLFILLWNSYFSLNAKESYVLPEEFSSFEIHTDTADLPFETLKNIPDDKFRPYQVMPLT